MASIIPVLTVTDPEEGTFELTLDGILLFDGVCNLCNASVDFIMRRERESRIRFASLQGDVAHQVLAYFGVDSTGLKSVLFVAKGKLYRESDAVLKATEYMGAYWPALGKVGLGLPRSFRDLVYQGVAKNRYRLFGKRDTCRLPMLEERARFVPSNGGSSI